MTSVLAQPLSTVTERVYWGIRSALLFPFFILHWMRTQTEVDGRRRQLTTSIQLILEHITLLNTSTV